jgi:protease I
MEALMHDLEGKKIAILATDGFEEAELEEPKTVLKKSGAAVEIVSPKAYQIQGFNYLEPSEVISVDKKLGEAKPEEYDALVLPGGVFSADHLRADPDAMRFVHAFLDADKPIAAIGHAPWLLIDGKALTGRRVTATATVRIDLADAGAKQIDDSVVVDGHLMTARGRDDLSAFCNRLTKFLAAASRERPATVPLIMP